MPGSLLESTRGSVLESAEALVGGDPSLGERRGIQGCKASGYMAIWEGSARMYSQTFGARQNCPTLYAEHRILPGSILVRLEA
jgi:hypothetical protein